MTKIYLVKFVNKEEVTWVIEAFTNLRKAKAYKRYWDAIMKNEPEKWSYSKTELEEVSIKQWDYTNAAIKEEMKELPY